MTRFLADRTARLAVRKATEYAARDQCEAEVWRANRERESFQVTSADDPIIPPAKQADQ